MIIIKKQTLAFEFLFSVSDYTTFKILLFICFCFVFLQVNPGSKAALQGIREGDVITSMNGQPTEKEVTNSQAHALLKEAGPTLRLGLKQLSRFPSIPDLLVCEPERFPIIGLGNRRK